MSGKGGCACCSKGDVIGGAVTAVLCAAVAVCVIYVAAVVLAGVFSWHGLAFSFGLAHAGALRFAEAVRVTTLAGLTEIAAGVSLVLDYLDGRRSLLLHRAWVIAHVTLARRLVFATGWLAVSAMALAGDIVARRPIHLPGRRIGVLGLGRELGARLSGLRSALVAPVARLGRRGRRTRRGAPTPATPFVPRVVKGAVLESHFDRSA